MAEFTLEQVMCAVQGRILKKDNTVFTDVVTDTRQINVQGLFVALCGEKFDGHDFLSAAVERGAAGIVVSRNYTLEELALLKATVIKVDDTLSAYQCLAGAYRERFAIPVIAITGSNGKTTTKDLTAAVLSGKWNVLKTKANYNNEIGLPLTLLQLDNTHEAAVVEMGMRGFGQIEELAKIAKPGIGIVTNVGETHMELLGSMEHIAKAKSELVELIPSTGLVILNDDDVYVKAMAKKAKGKVVTFGLTNRADIRAEQITTSEQGTSFHCIWQEQSFKVELPMLGRHNVYNALAAIAVGLALDLTIDEINGGLCNSAVTKMRLEIKKIKSYTMINDAYNASPASMRAGIETLNEIAVGRKIAVVGDMLELGDIANEAHVVVGKHLADKKIDAVITLGKMGKTIAVSAKQSGIKQVFACNTHEEAADALKKIVLAGDTVLLKGSRGMQMEKIIELI